jgi:hypothetical protein
MIMRQRLLCFLAVGLCAAALGTGPPQAQAAIRVTIEAGAESQTFLLPDAGGSTGLFAIGGVEFFVASNTSNLVVPGVGTFGSVGTLNTSVNITDSSPVSLSLLPEFTVTSTFVSDADFITPLRFTGPSGATLSVKSDVGQAGTNDTVLTGSVINTTVVNGQDVESLVKNLVTGLPSPADQTEAVPNTPAGYELSSVVTISGLNVGASVSISAASSVTGTPTPIPGPVPEPSSMAVLGLGSLGLGLVAARRRKLLQAQK